MIFEGEAPACKELGGTLVKNIHEVEVRALPQNLPHEIKVNIEGLKSFEDVILIKDLILPSLSKILKLGKPMLQMITNLLKQVVFISCGLWELSLKKLKLDK